MNTNEIDVSIYVHVLSVTLQLHGGIGVVPEESHQKKAVFSAAYMHRKDYLRVNCQQWVLMFKANCE